ncbi:hypothetical protein BV898_13763 [Hypsibius exemplaris]|uniref:Uncharacterized protein n=1 Tax=Hypsibius exemplaris TaxID=2072580 RepID=A0A1W0W9T3_HYPEX|nr:hypothetical protein BV898_13763 [Hypsibius exemplaris]
MAPGALKKTGKYGLPHVDVTLDFDQLMERVKAIIEKITTWDIPGSPDILKQLHDVVQKSSVSTRIGQACVRIAQEMAKASFFRQVNGVLTLAIVVGSLCIPVAGPAAILTCLTAGAVGFGVGTAAEAYLANQFMEESLEKRSMAKYSNIPLQMLLGAVCGAITGLNPGFQSAEDLLALFGRCFTAGVCAARTVLYGSVEHTDYRQLLAFVLTCEIAIHNHKIKEEREKLKRAEKEANPESLLTHQKMFKDLFEVGDKKCQEYGDLKAEVKADFGSADVELDAG